MRRLIAPLLLMLAATGASPAAVHAPKPKPRLVVVLLVDQMRGDYLGRYGAQWTGGFGRIYRGGAVFPNALQDHAITQTAPGHSTILSGLEPARTNIVFNDRGVPDTAVRLIGSDGTGASPHRFRGTTLVDWMRSRDSTTRFLSVSRKDRSAILPIGKTKGPVFWYSRGNFTTSTWYGDTLPSWVTGWNRRGGVMKLAGLTWNLLLPEPAYSEVDDQAFEHGGQDNVFPKKLPSDSAKLVNGIVDTPWMDSLTLDFALEGIQQLRLGQRTTGTDLVSVSLSSTDAVGHDYGPDSRELHDQLLRADRWVGWFLDSLSRTVAPEQMVLVLSADHGVTTNPVVARARGKSAGAVSFSPLVREVNERIGGTGVLKWTSGLIYADTAQLRALKVNPESLATALTARVQRMPHVLDAWSAATLGAPGRNNVAAVRWRRSIPRDFPFLVCAALEPGYVWGGEPGGGEHGTGNQEDVNVALAFLGPGIPAGVFPDTVRTVDIAPTLARMLDLKTPKRLDGQPIRRITK